MAGSTGKQTQLIALLLSKPLSQKLPQKINNEQKDKELSFVKSSALCQGGLLQPQLNTRNTDTQPLQTWTPYNRQT